MIYKLSPEYTFRTTDKILLFPFFILILPAVTGIFYEEYRITTVILSAYIIFNICYRLIFINILKKHTTVMLNDESISIKSFFQERTVKFHDIEVIAYIIRNKGTGDLILNLNFQNFTYPYINNLIFQTFGTTELRKNSLVIPDVINIKDLYSILSESLGIKSSLKEKIQCKDSEIFLYENGFSVKNIRSEIFYTRKERLIFKDKKIIIKTYDPGLNNLTFNRTGLPPLILTVS